jgi:hypothetical protein
MAESFVEGALTDGNNLESHVNLSYESEATIAAEIGVGEDQLNGRLSGKIKPRGSVPFKVWASALKEARIDKFPGTRENGDLQEV